MYPKPYEESVDIGEYSVRYATIGNGDWMVMLHGSDRRENWRIWESLLPLADSYSLLMPDFIGYGGSSRPAELPDYKVQAAVMHEMIERLSIGSAVMVGSSWGGQVVLEIAIRWPESVKSIILIASTYDNSQLPLLQGIRKPTLILWAEDDMITQLKAGYLLRDAIRTSRLEILPPVSKSPEFDFVAPHRLERYKSRELMEKMIRFLKEPETMIQEPPELEPELRGRALKESVDDKKEVP